MADVDIIVENQQDGEPEPETETGTTLNEAVEIAETIVETAKELERGGEDVARDFRALFDELRFFREENAAEHRKILERLDEIQTAVITASMVTVDAVEEIVDDAADETAEEIEEAAEEAVEEVKEEADETREEVRDEPEKRTRKRRFI